MTNLINIIGRYCVIISAFVLISFTQCFAANDDIEYLDVEDAFTLQFYKTEDGKLLLEWIIADGYFLYQDKFNFHTKDGEEIEFDYSEPFSKYDVYFEKTVNVYKTSASQLLDVDKLTTEMTVSYQGCADEGLCYPPQWLEVSTEGLSLVKYDPAKFDFSNDKPIEWAPIIYTVLAAFVGGMVLNLMPCVFPVLAIKVLGLVQSSQMQQKLYPQGFAYMAGTVVSFLFFACLLIVLRASGEAIGWGFQLQSPIFILGLLILFFVMGLSLSGVVQFGGGFAGVGQELTQKPGLKGSFYSGVLATVVASPCTAPFMGTALGFALTQPLVVSLVIFASLGFGMAFPYLLLTIVPGLSRFLPKPGAWMNTFKQVSAFALYLTCVWLIWVLGRQTDPETVAIVLAGLVFLTFALWRHGQYQLIRISKTAVVTLIIASATMIYPFTISKTQASLSQLEEVYSPQLLKKLLDTGEPVFVNVTAKWCITCLANYKVALNRQAVVSQMRNDGIHYLVADWTQRDAAITNLITSHNRGGVPLYLWYPPGSVEPTILPQILTENIVLRAIAPL